MMDGEVGQEGLSSGCSPCLLDPSVIPAGVGENLVDKGRDQQKNKMKAITI